ncbi:MAG: hypothetical protein B7Y99_09955 [Caulobacterales bacterium 32-69-10]|nr:MAG: hypothetical protein B7Y99_09955 [Caulobacterales bacterium 32-69-10]
MSVLYPVAETAEAALQAPKGFCAREREAAGLAGEAVTFVTEAVGPAFASQDAALDAYAGRLDDERPGRRVSVAPEQRWCALRPVAAPAKKKVQPAEPAMKDGRRWPARDPARPAPLWRLSVSYWRIGKLASPTPTEAARKLRRQEGAESLDPAALRALARQPMQAVRPQQPLDIGLFETRPPEAPHILMPDE